MNDRFKRPFDLTVTVAALLLLSPFWAGAGGLRSRWRSGLRTAAPSCTARRGWAVGGRLFRIVKFRTMVVGAEDRTGPVRAARGDARVTAVGRLLRRFHLDELPQVANVFKGEMSLVGTRPERPALAERFEREAPADARPSCDYLLVVGPGRSGKHVLYRLLNGHAAFESPAIKDAYYYRSPRRRCSGNRGTCARCSASISAVGCW